MKTKKAEAEENIRAPFTIQDLAHLGPGALKAALYRYERALKKMESKYRAEFERADLAEQKSDYWRLLFEEQRRLAQHLWLSCEGCGAEERIRLNVEVEKLILRLRAHQKNHENCEKESEGSE